MPRYKKKKHNRLLSSPKNRVKAPKNRDYSYDITMSPSKDNSADTPNKKEKIRVIKGKKPERRRKISTAIVIVGVVLIVSAVLQILLPAGIIQTAKNLVSLVGTGNYPITVSGGEVLSVDTQNNYYYLLTDTHISAYSSGGKVLFSRQHGFDKPILVTSKGKALIYNQGGQQYSVFDLNGKFQNFDTEEKIITAAIADNGNYAVATYSNSYASAVTVFSKRNKQIYEWYSAEDTVNNIALSSTGKKLAVSSFNSSSGLFKSKVNVINFKTATPEFSQEYENRYIYGLSATHKFGFSVIKSNGVDFIKWSNHAKTEYTDDYKITYFRHCGSSVVCVFNRDSDMTDNKIVIFNSKGDVKESVNYKGVINDIRVKGSNIYCINDSTVSVLDFEGNVKFTAEYGYGGSGITVISANVVAVVTDIEIQRVKLNAD